MRMPPSKQVFLRQSERVGFGVLAECLPHIFRHPLPGSALQLQCMRGAPLLKNRGLSFAEREEIALECARGTSVRAIARKLRRSPSTISREIRRNSATRGGDFDYRAINAQWHADRAAKRPKASKLTLNLTLRDYVQDRLSGLIATPDGIAHHGPVVVWKGRRAVHRQSRRWSSAWSPEQISQRLKVDFPEDPTMRISHEAIYQALYIQGRGALKRELSACLRSGRALRLPRERGRSRCKSFLTDALTISDRPAEISDRAVPGHSLPGRALRSNVPRGGRATSFLVLAARRSVHWSNAQLASPCSCTCHE